MAQLPAVPLKFSAEQTQQIAVENNQFGDRQAQRISIGNKPIKQVWKLEWGPISTTDKETLRLYFTGLAGADTFQWTPPGQSTELEFICTSYKETADRAVWNVSIEAEQVFYQTLGQPPSGLRGSVVVISSVLGNTGTVRLNAFGVVDGPTASLDNLPVPTTTIGLVGTLTSERQVTSTQVQTTTALVGTLSQSSVFSAAIDMTAALTRPLFISAADIIATDVAANLGAGTYGGVLTVVIDMAAQLLIGLPQGGADTIATDMTASLINDFRLTSVDPDEIIATTLSAALLLTVPYGGNLTCACDMTGSTLWNPSFFGSNLAAWYDFDDSATQTFVSTAISAITSKGSVSRTLTQATGAARPTTQPTGLNGKRTASYDGSDSLNAGSISVPGQNYTIFVVANPTNNDPAIFDYGLRSSLYRTASGNVNMYASNQQATYDATKAYTASATWGTGFRILGIRDTSTANTQAWVDGTSTDFGVNTDRGTAAGPTSFALGSWGDGSGGFLIGGLAEYIEVIGDVSIADKERIEGYLAHKWGLTANLPGAHPYKTTPP